MSEFAELDRRIRKRLQELVSTFGRSTAQELRSQKGIHLERYKEQRDERARTIRITDKLRGVVCDTGDDDHYVLYTILPHDEADQWMRNNSFGVNPATGAFEVVNFEAVAGAAQDVPDPPAGEKSLFAHRKDKDFTQLGIEAGLVPLVRKATSEEDLLGLLEVLPQAQSETLILLTGDDTVETIYREIAGSTDPEEIDDEDLVAAIKAPASRSTIHIVADETELQEMLAQPLAQWRTFLHESQHSVAYKPTYNGPARVTGGAGTGKTVVAMHRALQLSRAVDAPAGKPILFTTFTRNLAESIERDLRQLGGADLLDVVEVLNVDTLANRIVREAEGSAPGIIAGADLDLLWQEISDELGTSQSGEFLSNEWEQVVLAQGCRSQADYLKASRAGRGIRLDRRSRAEVWRAIEAFSQRLVERNQRTFLQLADAAAGHLARRSAKPYEHVIVDEAQDLHEAQWRMLRAVVPEHKNDLFIVGDSHQRIYDRRSSLSKVGINIVGRSRKLRINYRTTHEILKWSLSLLGEGSYDDLDEGTDDQTFAGYHSFLHGAAPTTEEFSSTSAQLAGLVDRVRQWIDDGVDEEDIAVTARSTSHFEGIEAALTKAGIGTCKLGRELPKGDGVRIGTMHRLKGVEFRCVAVFDADDHSMPLEVAVTPESADPVQHNFDIRRERCLLYVACTRARDDLWVGWSGKPSRFLEPLLKTAE